ncbi:MAG: STY4851/ECs_5259 family protein [Gallionella sp.]
MTPEKHLLELLKTRGLERADGRMLYAYRVTNEEYQSLRQMLGFATEFGDLDSVAQRMRDFSALFVLYAAEWWRREYQGGAWKWSSILDTFCEGGDTLNTTIRTACVERGFAYWGHRPEGTGKKFFGAIVAHGGLPLHFIGLGEGKLSDMMDAMLRQAARYHWDREQIINAIEERAKSVQKQEVYSLIADIVSAVLTLKQDFHLSGEIDPVSVLNAKAPDWRERFPLSLEDDAAQTLLIGLVKEAALQMPRATTGAFQVVRELKKVGEQYALRSVLVLPKKLAIDELKTLFKLSDLPRYFLIDIHANARLLFCTGRQTFGADTVTLTGKNCVLTGETARAEHLLYLCEQSGREIGTPLPVVGGAELAQDQPWIFVSRDEQLQWVASGRVSVPEEAAWIALPDGWTIDASNGEADFVGHCDDIAARQLYQVRGEIILEGDEQRYRVRTKQVSDTSENYVWEGSRLPYSSSPPLVFLGLPRLYRYSAEGERYAVQKTALDWFVAGTQKRIEQPELAKGLMDVYLIKEGERQTRFRLTVLGNNARVNFSSGMSSSEGVIELANWGNIQVAVDASELSCKQESTPRGVKLQLHAGDTPPEVINMTLRWQNYPRELRLSLPFPSTGGRFFDAHGKILREGSKLALHHLTGTRLRIFDRNPDRPKRYDLEFTLTQNGKRSTRDSQLFVKRSIPLLNNGSAEIRLIDLERDIEKLMSFSDELDATVKITLLVGNSSSIFVNVSRYETELERHPYSLGLPAKAIERLDLVSRHARPAA